MPTDAAHRGRVSQKPAVGRAPTPPGPRGERHRQLALLCKLIPSPDAWFFRTSGKTTLLGQVTSQHLLGACCVPGLGRHREHSASGFPEAAAQTRPRRELPPPAPPGAPSTCDVFRASLGSGPPIPSSPFCHRDLLLPKGLLGCELTRLSLRSGPLLLPARCLAAVRTVRGNAE